MYLLEEKLRRMTVLELLESRSVMMRGVSHAPTGPMSGKALFVS